MDKIDRKYRRFCVTETATIIEALQVIEDGKERICFVVDKLERLVRVVTDGDIRRALLKGVNSSELVKNIHKKSDSS